MSRNILEKSLQNVHRRGRTRILYESISSGLVFAGVLLILFFGVHFVAGWPLMTPWLFTLLAVASGAVGGVLIGLLTPLDRFESARQIDRHYRLKDRVLTAAKISVKSQRTVVENLQIDDATRHVELIIPEQIVPYRISNELYKIAAVFVPVFILCLLATFAEPTPKHALAVANETVLAILDNLRDELAVPMQQLALENPDDEEIQKLHEKITNLMDRFEGERSDPQKALLTLNRMEQEIIATIKEFDLEAMDASLKELGESLLLSEATRPAGESLIGGDYEKGATELEKSDFEMMSNSERHNIGKQLAQVADSMQYRRQAQLAKMTHQLSENLKKGDNQGCQNTACEFAGVCRKQCGRKGACDKLNCQLAKLGLCKSQCAGECSSCPRKGECASSTASKAQGDGVMASDTGSKQPFGEETGGLDTTREKQNVTGIRGEGNSETKILRGGDAPEDESSLTYEKRIHEYRKQAQSILETEPLPFEQHQVIRRYFDSLAPEK